MKHFRQTTSCWLISQALCFSLLLQGSGIVEAMPLPPKQTLLSETELEAALAGTEPPQPSTESGDNLAGWLSSAWSSAEEAIGSWARSPWPAAAVDATVQVASAGSVLPLPPRLMSAFLNSSSRVQTGPPSPPGMTADRTGQAPPAEIAGLVHKNATEQIPLLAGYNLISMPEEPADLDPAAVFAAIAGQLGRVEAYDACDLADPWKLYDPADPTASDLTVADHKIGMWVEATTAAVLPSDGTLPATTSLQLCEGWNLIGFPAGQPRHPLAALAPIAGKWQRLFAYDVFDNVDPWEVYDPAVPDWANDLQLMQPGRGYWLLVTEATTLDFRNQGPPPTVAISAPADLAVVTEPTEIAGIVDSDRLEGWTLTYRPISSGDAVTLATGNAPVSGGAFATFDPTLLLNGLYELELTATDVQGQQVSVSITVSVEGQMKVGHFTLSFVDLAIPLSGLDIEIIRTYDSRDKELRDFGFGWSLDIRQGSYRNNRTPGDGWQFQTHFLPCDTILESKSHLTVVRLSDQEIYRFALQLQDGVPSTSGGCFATARFDFIDGPLPGTTLEIGGNDQVFFENGSDRVIDVDTLDIYEPENVRLRTRDGRIFELDLETGVTHLEDLNGNALEISRDGIVHSSGIGINFTRDSQGRIKEIKDPRGSRNLYTYSADSDLMTHTDRAGGVMTFSYRPQHLLERIDDALGVPGIRTEYDEDGRMIRVIDASGRATEFEHDLSTRREVVRDKLGFVRILDYDARGNVIRELDELGNETIREFDSRDNLLRMRDPLMRENTFIYDPAGVDLLSATNAAGQTFAMAYDAKGSPLSFTGPNGSTIFEYDANNRLQQMTDAAGAVYSLQYDSRGDVTKETGPVGDELIYTYDQNGWVGTVTESFGAAVEFDYDEIGNIVERTEVRTAANGSTQTFTTSFQYDPLGRVVSKTHADGAVTSSEFDAIGRLVRRTDPLGEATAFTYDLTGRLSTVAFPDSKTAKRFYDAEGRLTRQEDRQGRQTTFAYDAVGRGVETTFPDGSLTRRVYDAAGQVIELIDERGLTTRFVYDALGRGISTVTPNGSTTTSSYDAQGNLASVTDASGRETEYRYDAMGRLIETILPDGASSSVEYDPLGRKTADVDLAGVRTEYTYDDPSRTLEVENALGGVTAYAYDEYGNLLTKTDAAGKETRYFYDPRERRTGRLLPDGSANQLVYDLAGQLIRKVDFNGDTTDFRYDALGRMTERISPDGTATFTYTGAGRVATAAFGALVSSYEYDLRDRLSRKSTGPGESVDYTWTLDSRLASMSIVAGGGLPLTTEYQYDGDGRVLGIEDPFGGSYSFQYDAAGRKLAEQYPNGTESSYTYDAVGRLIGKETSSGTDPLQSFSYTLGSNGQRLSVIDRDGIARRYEYDDLYRLTAERIEDVGGVLLQTTTYGYDSVGNRLFKGKTVAGSPEVLTSYQYDPRDRLTQTSSSTSTSSYTWDDNGNRLEQQGDGAAVLSWSPRNELVGIQASGIEVDYGYDAMGTLISRTSSDTSADPAVVTTTDWLVDESISTRRVIAELDGSAQSLEALYVVGPSLGAPLARFTPGGMSYFHTDGLGSVTGVSDSGGQLLAELSYQPFGQRSPAGGPEFGFRGELQDPRSGLVHLRARWLDPVTGSFLSMDPFADTTQPLFAYAANDPINRIDPSGLFSVVETNMANMIATTLNGIQAEAFYIFIAGAEEGTAGVLKAIKDSITFAVLGAAAGPILGGLVRIVKRLRGVTRALKIRFYISRFSSKPKRINDIRGTTLGGQNMVGRKVTIANAYVDVGGRKRELLGNSGPRNEFLEKSLDGADDAGFGRPQLAPDVPDLKDGNHAERKILELLKGELNEADSGTIVLYVDHFKGEGPCTSCSEAIEEFLSIFENINILVL